jgi:hypothetical protein
VIIKGKGLGRRFLTRGPTRCGQMELMSSTANGFPGEMEKFCTPEDMSDVDNPHARIYLYS